MQRMLAAIAITLTASLAALPGQAALIETDYLNSGDGLLIYDDVNQREWLDVTATTGMSANQALAQHGRGGFRIATSAEVGQLFSAAGIPDVLVGAPQINPRDPGTRGTVANRSPVEALLALMNHTAPFTATGGNRWVHGFTDYGSDSNLTLSRFSAFSWDAMGRAQINTNNTYWRYNSTHRAVGTFLLRETAAAVPEPATLGMLVLGVLGLIGVQRRTRRGQE